MDFGRWPKVTMRASQSKGKRKRETFDRQQPHHTNICTSACAVHNCQPLPHNLIIERAASMNQLMGKGAGQWLPTLWCYLIKLSLEITSWRVVADKELRCRGFTHTVADLHASTNGCIYAFSQATYKHAHTNTRTHKQPDTTHEYRKIEKHIPHGSDKTHDALIELSIP